MEPKDISKRYRTISPSSSEQSQTVSHYHIRYIFAITEIRNGVPAQERVSPVMAVPSNMFIALGIGAISLFVFFGRIGFFVSLAKMRASFIVGVSSTRVFALSLNFSCSSLYCLLLIIMLLP